MLAFRDEYSSQLNTPSDHEPSSPSAGTIGLKCRPDLPLLTQRQQLVLPNFPCKLVSHVDKLFLYQAFYVQLIKKEIQHLYEEALALTGY